MPLAPAHPHGPPGDHGNTVRGSSLLIGAGVAAVVLLVGVLVVVLGTGTAAANDVERRLAAARADLERVRVELSEAGNEVERSAAALATADAQLATVEEAVNAVAAAVEAQRVLVRDAEARLAVTEAELAVLEAAFVGRVAQRFKQGPQLAFETLLNAPGAQEAVIHSQLLERVLARDQVDLERLAARQRAVTAQRDVVQAEQERLDAQLTVQEELLVEAEELRGSRSLAAAEARRRAAELRGERDELEADEERLAALLVDQQAEARRRAAAAAAAAARVRAPSAPVGSPAPAPAPAPRAAPGGFAWPMCAPVTSEYGPRWGRLHRGIDLGAPTGTPIRAIQSGRVIFAGWQGGYGQLTLIDHGGVVSAYAHQSRFAVGQGFTVERGQVIGYVGTTGNTTGPHLHLEIRVGGSAVNPRQYLAGSPC